MADFKIADWQGISSTRLSTLDSDVLRMRGHAPFPHMHKMEYFEHTTLDHRACVTLFLLAKKFPDFQPKMSHAQSGRDEGRGT